jgi:hypothetical protein
LEETVAGELAGAREDGGRGKGKREATMGARVRWSSGEREKEKREAAAGAKVHRSSSERGP